MGAPSEYSKKTKTQVATSSAHSSIHSFQWGYLRCTTSEMRNRWYEMQVCICVEWWAKNVRATLRTMTDVELGAASDANGCT